MRSYEVQLGAIRSNEAQLGVIRSNEAQLGAMRSWWGILTENWEFLREFLIFPHFSLTNLITCAKYNIVRFCSHPQFQLTNPFSYLSLHLFQVPLQTLPNWGPVRSILRNSQCSSLDPQCSSVLLSAPQCSSVLIIGPHLLLAPPYHTYLLLTTPHWSSLLLSPHRSSLLAYALGPIRMS